MAQAHSTTHASPSTKYNAAKRRSRFSRPSALSGAMRKGSPLAGSDMTLTRAIADYSVWLCDARAAASRAASHSAASSLPSWLTSKRASSAC